MKPNFRFAICSFFLFMIFGVAINSMEEVRVPPFKCGNEPALPNFDLEREIFSDINIFAFDLFKKIRAPGENRVFSPYNIQTCMGLVLAGAKGDTLQTMNNCLHLGFDSEQYFESCCNLQQKLLASNTPETTFKLSSDVWVQEGINVHAVYAERVKKCFGATPTALDFEGQPEISCNTINEKVCLDTNGEITNILAQVTKGTQVILTSATLFESAWASQFPENTNEGPFTLSNGSVKNVHYMQQTDYFSRGEDEQSEWILLPYKNDFAALIVLPKEGLFEAVASSINQESFNSMMNSVGGQTVDVKFPKFTIRSAPNLKEVFRQIGLGMLFEPSTCDLSGILARGEKLAISDMVHQAMMEVTPNGTKAAAATAVFMAGLTSINRPVYPVAFHATRPFLFFVVNTLTNTIIFMSEVNNP